MQILGLVKAGFGSYINIKNLDSDDFLDMLEYQYISNKIEEYEYSKARR